LNLPGNAFHFEKLKVVYGNTRLLSSWMYNQPENDVHKNMQPFILLEQASSLDLRRLNFNPACLILNQ